MLFEVLMNYNSQIIYNVKINIYEEKIFTVRNRVK